MKNKNMKTKNWISNTIYEKHATTTVFGNGGEMTSWPESINSQEQHQIASDYLSAQGKFKDGTDDSEYAHWHQVVVSDLQVIEMSERMGMNLKNTTKVMHWVYFDDLTDACTFSKLALEAGYKGEGFGASGERNELLVKLSHEGTLELGDISSRTLSLGIKAKSCGGRYDGWEITVRTRNMVPTGLLSAASPS